MYGGRFHHPKAAELTHLSEHTLRYYERLGLLNPIGRDSNGYRNYSRSNLTRIQFLRCLRATGMSIQKMQCYVELMRRGPQTADERRLLLVAHAQEVQEHIAELQQDLEGIGGRYLEDCQEAAPYEPSRESAEMPFHGYMPYALDPEQAEQLWTLSQDLVGLVS